MRGMDDDSPCVASSKRIASAEAAKKRRGSSMVPTRCMCRRPPAASDARVEPRTSSAGRGSQGPAHHHSGGSGPRRQPYQMPAEHQQSHLGGPRGSGGVGAAPGAMQGSMPLVLVSGQQQQSLAMGQMQPGMAMPMQMPGQGMPAGYLIPGMMPGMMAGMMPGMMGPGAQCMSLCLLGLATHFRWCQA